MVILPPLPIEDLPALIPTALPAPELPDSPAEITNSPAELESDDPVFTAITPESPAVLSPVARLMLPVLPVSEAAEFFAEVILT
jgi:hypothetical protein